MITPFITGFTLGASLIIAIGAQNAFILRQGLLRQHVFILCLICAVADASLIAAGVAGVGVFIEQSPILLLLIRLGGGLFLIWYAWVAFMRSRNPEALHMTNESQSSLKAAIATCLAFTFLNPHVYLDTLLLVGGLSTQFEGDARTVFGAGAVIASFVWFFSLGYGARLLAPVFAKPRAWQILDLGIAIVMLILAFVLLSPIFAG